MATKLWNLQSCQRSHLACGEYLVVGVDQVGSLSPSHSGGQVSTAKQQRLGEALNLGCPVSRFWLQIFLSSQ